MAFRYEKDDQNIVTLTLDMEGSTNVINESFGKGLEEAVARLEAEKDLAGVILTSAKKVFLAGADIEWLFSIEEPGEAFESCESLKALLRRLETLGKPVAAAIQGAALGGGLELALACHHRVALDSPAVRLGFPEVTLGLLPGAGGVTRVPRMIGLEKAFPFLTEGKRLTPREALELGIVDELAADGEDLLERARAWVLAHPESAQAWDVKGFRMPGGDGRHPRVAQMLAIAPAMLRKKTRGNYPAPEAILSTLAEGSLVDFDTASRIESRYFAKLASGKVAKNMIRAFWFQLNEIGSGHSRPQGVEPRPTKKLGVLGAGLMGHGIAYSSARAGIEVVLKDADQEKAEAGKARIAALLEKGVARGKLDEPKAQEILGRVHATGSADDLKGCDLVIEAVFEDRGLKARVTREAEERLEETAVFASNTSTLPITGLAEASARPERFVGIHFFSPVDKMKLVEIIRGEKTADAALARAFDYVLQIGKVPIVVNDSRGFYTSRVFGTYLNEGVALLAEGQDPRRIESAGLQAGMPVGPLAVTDEVSLALGVAIRKQTEEDLAAEGKTMPPHPAYGVIQQMVEVHGRPGRAGGGGFYEYPANDHKKYLWPKLRELFPSRGEELTQEEMIERMMFIQVLETLRCWQEGVFDSVADANIGSIFGWGFAPFKGGTLGYLEDYGVEAFTARCRELEARYGERFAPPAKLLEMAS